MIDCTSYWFPDYLADLHELLKIYSPDQPARLVGHSMGGNVAALYAGTMPERVRAIINIEGFGLVDSDPADAPLRYRQWIEAGHPPPGFSAYPNFQALARRIVKRNPHISAAQAEFVAREWSVETADGRVELRADPRHKLPNPVLYRRAEAEACWRAITAATLLVRGGASDLATQFDSIDCNALRGVQTRVIDGAGHMLHFETPRELAHIIDAFLSKHL